MSEKQPQFQSYPYPKTRHLSRDSGAISHNKHMIHALIEVDVTKPREKLRDLQAQNGEKQSFSAYIIHCLAVAVEQNKEVQAYLDWRSRLIVYDDINIVSMIEIELDGKKVPMPKLIHTANSKSYADIKAEILSARLPLPGSTEAIFMRLVPLVPAVFRRLFFRSMMKFPHLFRRFTSNVHVTAVGMFSNQGGFGLPRPAFSLTLTIGGISKKPWVVNDQIEIRQILDLTISFDHDIIDGAPAARFTHQLRELIESGASLEPTLIAGK